MRRDSALWVLALAVVAGCGGSTIPSPPITEDTGEVEESIVDEDASTETDTGTKEDVPVEMDVPTEMDVPVEMDVVALDAPPTPDAPSTQEAGLDASTPVDVAPPRDTPDVNTADVQVSCRRTSDCASAPGLPACDLVSGRCVECVPTSDTCAPGSYCDATRRCVPGCRNGSDCVGSPGGSVCDTTRRVCVGCLTDSQCAIGTVCTSGVCVPGCSPTRGCPTGETCCSGSCINTSASVTACGSCTRVCSTVHSTPSCMAGACVARCEAGWGDCDTSRDNGCETSTVNNPSHCGGCGVVCSLANASATCASDRCAIVACSAGYQDCDRNVMTGCEAALMTSTTHCGACGNACATGQSCNSGVCQCPTGQTLCLGACTPTQSDRLNCGACNLACPAGQMCVSGACTSRPLYHGWTSPVAGCSTTSYNATAPTALGGTYPYNTGDSAACRAWKVAATVCTTQPVNYSSNENWTCSSSGGFTDPTFGTYCARTSQYACSTCPGACNAGPCRSGQNTLRNCSGSEVIQP